MEGRGWGCSCPPPPAPRWLPGLRPGVFVGPSDTHQALRGLHGVAECLKKENPGFHAGAVTTHPRGSIGSSRMRTVPVTLPDPCQRQRKLGTHRSHCWPYIPSLKVHMPGETPGAPSPAPDCPKAVPALCPSHQGRKRREHQALISLPTSPHRAAHRERRPGLESQLCHYRLCDPGQVS